MRHTFLGGGRLPPESAFTGLVTLAKTLFRSKAAFAEVRKIERERIKRQTIANRRLLHQRQAA